MSFYNWIQEKLFDNYEEWRLKSPDYNGNGFNIVGIDNTVNVNIRMYNFDDVQCTVIPSVAYGFVTGMNLQLC